MRTKTPFLREKMLEAAGKLFGSKRFHEVRMEDIAAEAAVSKGTLYRYFQDKEEMFLAILARASHELVLELRARVAEANTSRERLIAVADAIITFFDRRPHLFDLIQRAELAQGQGRAFPWQEARDKGMRIVLDIFAAARQAGEFTVSQPETAMLMLLGGLRAVVRAGVQPRPQGLARDIVDGFLIGAAAPTRKRSQKLARV